jgi:hypothetical protein
MSLHDDDRCDHEGDERADRATREEAEASVEFVDAMRQRIREFVRAEANLLALTYPRFIDVRDLRNPTFPLQIDEAIEGFVEIVDDAFGDLLDGAEVTRARNIAENGYD